MKKWVPLLVIGGIVLVVGGWFMSRYNGLVTSSTEVDARWAQVDNQLQRRNDLIPNLVATVQGYAAHEKEIFTQIAEARAKLAGGAAAGPTAETAAASNQLSSALSRLLVISENYPQLKADAQFTGLRDELAGTENRIATERGRYNEAVRDYTNKTKSFPGNVVAGMFGFEAKTYFEAEAAAKTAPKVKF